MPRNTLLALYLAAIETAEGVDQVPTATANAIALAASLDPETDFAFRNPRDTLVRGVDINAYPPLPPKGEIYQWAKTAWFRGVTGAIASGNAIELDPWLQSAGFAVTYSGAAGSEQAAYTLASTGLKTMTEYMYVDSILRRGVGARSEIGLSFDVGGPVVVSTTSQGIFAGEADVAVPASPVFKTTVPPVGTDMTTFTVDGFATGIIRKFSFATGNSITRRDGVKATGGVAGFSLDSRKATWEVVLEEPTITAKDFKALIRTQADVAISWLLGGTKYNMLGFDASQAKVDSVKPSSDNGNAIITIGGGLYGAAPVTLTVK